MLEHNLVLKSDELYLVGDISTDSSGERATGLYLRDTRHLSRFTVKVNGADLELLSARVHHPTSATVILTNNLTRLANGEMLLPHTLAVEERISLSTDLQVDFTLHNYGRAPLSLTLSFEIASDFRDLFDIRGFPRAVRGRMLKPEVEAGEIVLGYLGLDDIAIGTALTFDREPTVEFLRATSLAHDELVPVLPGFDILTWEPAAAELPGVLLTFEVALAPGQNWRLRTSATPRGAWDEPISAIPTVLGRPLDDTPDVTTDNLLFDRLIQRCALDLATLQTSFREGSLPAAGIPWFVAPFGRDSLITALQGLHRSPMRAAGTLRVLAALQGSRIDTRRDEQPGKILHEIRYGEMARLGEIPHTPYYGSVDATPLFLMLFAETVAWTGDNQLYRDLAPHARRAIAWIEEHGDLDGDGFVEYRTDGRGDGHILHQVWKDSFDSLHHADGRSAIGDIAAVEVQGYVYSGYRRLAQVAAHFGDSAWSNDVRTRAEALRERIEESFWLEPEGFYAQALDGDKSPVRTISSNSGHLLLCGVPSPDRAARLAARFLEPDMSSGWGIRTLSATCPTYNPMSYHNGSVWPHDNSLIAAGLYRYGQTEAANAITTALFDAARSQPLDRLPELYCGFARDEGADDAPVAYPVSCSPQAWAAGAMPLLVRSMLGLSSDLETGRVVVNPALPHWLGRVTIHNMDVLGRRISLTVRRQGDDYAIESDDHVTRKQRQPVGSLREREKQP